MRKHVITLLVLFVVSAHTPQKAEGGAFATEVTQILNHAQLVLAYIRQGLQLENELAMYANMLRNTKNLSNQTIRPRFRADINALGSDRAGGPGAGLFIGKPRSDVSDDVSRIRENPNRLLHELSKVVPDDSRYNSGSSSCRRTAKPANAE